MTSSRLRWCSLSVAAVTTLAITGLATTPIAHAASTSTAATVGARSNATRLTFPINDEMQASVDVGTGNLMVTSSDRQANSINGLTAFGVAYQSRAAGSEVTNGAAGAGWFLPMGQDTKLVAADDGSVLFLSPNGAQGVFKPISGSSSYTAPAGFRQSLSKNSDGTWSMTDQPSQSKMTFSSAGQLTSMTDRNGQVTSVAYSGGNQSSVTLPTGAVVNITFSNGKLASMTQPANSGVAAGTVTYAYDDNGRLSSITRPALPGGSASTVKFTYSSAGDLASITDALGHVTQVAYDTSHRVTSVSQGVSGNMATTRLSYASSTQTLVASPTTDQASAVTAVPHTTYTLDGDGRVLTAVDALGRKRSATYTNTSDVASTTNGTGGVTSATYGANGGPMTKLTSPLGSSQSWTYGTGSNAYNPATATDAQGNQSTMTYSNTGNPASTTSGGAVAKVTYNSDGTVATSTDPAGHVTTYTESASGKYTAKITPPSGSGIGATTIVNSPATSVTNGAGQTTTYAYNDRFQPTSVTTGNGAVSFVYDANGQLVTRTDPNQKATYSYDPRGHVTSIATTPVASSAPAAQAVSYTYDLAGNMTSRTVAGSTTKYVYDADNNLISMTEPSGAVTLFAYDNANRRVDTWWHANSTHTTWVAHTHNVFGVAGNLGQTYTSVKSSDAAANRMSDYSYCYAKYKAGTACPYNTSSAANTGLIQYMTNNKAGTVIQFGYDKQNRLISASNWAGHNYAYTYDADGNRTSTTVDGTKTQTLTFNAANEITSSGYSYDAAGRRTADPKAGKSTWNAFGQTVAATSGSESGTLSYAGLGQDEMIRQTNGSTVATYTYGRDNQAGIPREEYITKTGATNTLINSDAFGKPLDFVEGSASQFVMYDGTGSMIGTIDTAGANTSTYHLDPYGAILSITSGANAAAKQPQNGTATGKLGPALAAASAGGSGEAGWATFGIEGSVSNQWKRGARWNDTLTGTWTSVDPITTLNDPARADAYVYAGDNPLNATDPSGRSFFGCLSAAAATGAGFLGFGGAIFTAPETFGGSLVIASAGLATLSGEFATLDQCF